MILMIPISENISFIILWRERKSKGLLIVFRKIERPKKRIIVSPDAGAAAAAAVPQRTGVGVDAARSAGGDRDFMGDPGKVRGDRRVGVDGDHAGAQVPEQPAPDQPVKAECSAGVAVRVTVLAWLFGPEQVRPQLIAPESALTLPVPSRSWSRRPCG